jgi:hypothetical protein
MSCFYSCPPGWTTTGTSYGSWVCTADKDCTTSTSIHTTWMRHYYTRCTKDGSQQDWYCNTEWSGCCQ